jgi:hypothetical protein
LKNRGFIETEKYPSKTNVDGNFLTIIGSYKPDKCKIKLLGIEYLNKVSVDKIELSLAKSNIDANNLNLKNSKFNNRVNIANIVIGAINILVALGLAWWSHKVGLLE